MALPATGPAVGGLDQTRAPYHGSGGSGSTPIGPATHAEARATALIQAPPGASRQPGRCVTAASSSMKPVESPNSYRPEKCFPGETIHIGAGYAKPPAGAHIRQPVTDAP